MKRIMQLFQARWQLVRTGGGLKIIIYLFEFRSLVTKFGSLAVDELGSDVSS